MYQQDKNVGQLAKLPGQDGILLYSLILLVYKSTNKSKRFRVRKNITSFTRSPAMSLRATVLGLWW